MMWIDDARVPGDLFAELRDRAREHNTTVLALIAQYAADDLPLSLMPKLRGEAKRWSVVRVYCTKPTVRVKL